MAFDLLGAYTLKRDRRIQAFPRNAFPLSRGAAVSPYPIFGSRYVLVSDVPISRRFRLIVSLVRVRCWFWTARLALVSSYPFVGAP